MARAKKSEVAQTLSDYITEHEDAAQAVGVVLNRVTYPGAAMELRQGRYGGIRVADGELGAVYSDGSKH
ncbi:hypothetical protein [Allopusillimonas ginsengisoli]|uniref:hypothetical protein n=1 Tax=Allopusillimonas ginsengisoli TaxID=453575 RepID=UPI00102036FF|nr:hypothetical protein [Allopusillimonas ginsengisoli]TEA78645.1 hypothetical protein ERE07_09625 [Allopusillimonas ginsengisoli]